MATAPPPLRAVVVDDSPLQCSAFRLLLERRYAGRVEVETYNDPAAAVERLAPDVGLLVLDWEMPGLDGAAVVEEARRRGVDIKRVIISSGHPADRLHEVFDPTGCLAVIEKGERRQQEALLMILDALMRRHQRDGGEPPP